MAKKNVKYVLTCETDTFSSTVTGETFKINHKCCGKQYVGETTEEFRFRLNHYKSNE